MTRRGSVVSLRPITDANREAVEALGVRPEQRRFVSSVRESMVEAAEEPHAHALYWAIYDDESPVGFVMIADEVDTPDYVPHFLWKLLIDERYQRRGLGTATLDLIVEHLQAWRRCDVDERDGGRGEPGRVLRAVRLPAHR